MKLLFCPNCKDLKSLRPRFRVCTCGQSSARVESDLNSVVYRGSAIILAMKDDDLETLSSMESNIVFNYFKMKESYRTMREKASPLMIAEMGHRPHG
jgi:hypothetical protein